MEIYIDPEEKIKCPYNNAHYISRKRMGVHVTKCKKNYPETPLKECDFNVTHKIPEPELQYHHETCPDRKKIEIAVYQDSKTDLNKFPVVNIHVATEESWDNDNVPTYNPQKYCEANEIIRHRDVVPPSERRNFRNEERRRIENVRDNTEKSAIHETRATRQENAENQRRRLLPEVRTGGLIEDTPDSIAEIVQRIKIDANKAYNTKIPNK